ncbi:nucleotidyltransferase-like protein [Sutcliffiella horikoshii]|uniref:nucleotidyltransferase-like protein n=1 Tax=Sutcliffiella horikoshii TaxID=79883 RepID=UPI001CFDB9AC|nr:nucleotidyltransferase-like protein [Sutcliffiella horikoshii]
MEDLLRPIYQERASQSNTQGILMIEKKNPVSPNTDKFDVILFMVVKELDESLYVKHYELLQKKAALYIASEKQLEEWITLGTNRRVIDWIINGKVLFDRNEFIYALRGKLLDFPLEDRKLKIGLEFAKLIRRYLEGKDFFDSKHYIDAYNHIVHSLHHLARLAVIDHGFHPEITVWNQVKKIEPEIYKLYEELIQGDEPIDKRLELLFLANEFMIYSRTRTGAKHLIEVLMEKEEAWSYNEMLHHPKLQKYSVDLSVLVEYLVEKGFLEVEKKQTKGNGVFHRLYQVAPEKS